MRLHPRLPELSAVGLMLVVVCFSSCRHPRDTMDTALMPAGEPEIYSATVTRIAVNGSWREAAFSQVERRGEWRREQWSGDGGPGLEGGAARAEILRPDLGKGYLLDLNNRLYVEFNYGGPAPASPGAMNGGPPTGDSQPADAMSPVEVDRAFSDVPSPIQVERRTLADQTNQGHPCQVTEERVTFASGSVQLTRTLRARDLAGLPLLIEIESSTGAKFTIERRGVRLEASPDDFLVPPDFKRVERLPEAHR